MLEQQLGRILGQEMSGQYVEMNRSYLQMNAIRFGNGDTDYLAMMATPAGSEPPSPQTPTSRYIDMSNSRLGQHIFVGGDR